MTHAALISPDDLRGAFSHALSAMYRREVPAYGTLLELVAQTNGRASAEPGGRLAVERHGAIRLGTAGELSGIRRLFAVMGMRPVGYYDLSGAGIPVHSTAFRPVDHASLAANPFRMFTSLLRPELIEPPALREEALCLLARRRIFTGRLEELVALAEAEGGLPAALAGAFVEEALHTFRWHRTATADASAYRRLRAAHPLVADVACFRGPHVNHLTPRTLDIDAVQAGMRSRGLKAKAVIEGPPRRRVPILLRQTSFAALDEPVLFEAGPGGHAEEGAHTARFGEVEQRGAALTSKGRALYDRLLAQAREAGGGEEATLRAFAAFPDDARDLDGEGLAFFRPGTVEPILYEDFLPVSAAGIFRSNLGAGAANPALSASSRQGFEEALGAVPEDEMALYAAAAGRAQPALRSARP